MIRLICIYIWSQLNFTPENKIFMIKWMVYVVSTTVKKENITAFLY